MTSIPSRALVPVLTAVVIAVLLTGCSTAGFASQGGSPKPAGASASPTPGSSKPAPAKPQPKSPFTIPSTCLSASEVSNLLGQPEAGPTATADTGQLICAYLTATQDGAIINYQTKVGASPDALKAEADNPPAGATVTPIPGLADAAYELKTAQGEGIIMVTGSTVITIAGGATTRDRVVALAVDVLAS